VKPRISAVYRGDPRGTLVEPKGNKMAPTAKLPPNRIFEFILWILLFSAIAWAIPWWLVWETVAAFLG
jgi:ABC-type uncharacterized transport system permease subunit